MKFNPTQGNHTPPESIRRVFNSFYETANRLINTGLDVQPALHIVKRTGKVVTLDMREYNTNQRASLSKVILVSPQTLFTMFTTEAWAAEATEDEFKRGNIIPPSKRENKTEVAVFIMDGYRGSELLGLAPIIRDMGPHHLGNLVFHTSES